MAHKLSLSWLERFLEEACESLRGNMDALYFHLYPDDEAEWQSKGSPELLSYLPTPRNAVDYIMDIFPIVKRKDEKGYGEYRTKRRILEIYEQMTQCLDIHIEYRYTLKPSPGAPCDNESNFIHVEQWDIYSGPKNIDKQKLMRRYDESW